MTDKPIERLRLLVGIADPEGTVTVRWLAGLIGERLDDDEPEDQPPGDLTVEEVAEHFKRSPSTVRGWLGRGELEGYKLNRKSWRVTRMALREYEQLQREGRHLEDDDDEDVDITEWRRAS